MDRSLAKEGADETRTQKAENTGVLISSGLIAGGALTAVVIAFVVLGYNLLGVPPADPATNAALGLKADEVPTFLDSARGALALTPSAWFGLIAFLGVLYLLVWVPLRASRNGT
jgi:hypothetical protein